MKIKYIVFLAITLLLISCEKNWHEEKLIELDKISPIGLAIANDNIWIADGDNNRVVQLDKEGNILEQYEDFDRPMHLIESEGVIYVPEYGSDQITKIKDGNRSALEIPVELDAPAGIAIQEGKIAIADFYNHRIVFFNGSEWVNFGKEGKNKGQLYYPTDVSIDKETIYVADAYNNRIQTFSFEGSPIDIIGESDGMNAATGICVHEDEIYITDFENDRVMVYDTSGKKKQEIVENIDKPTDIFVDEGFLYITNYKGKSILKLTR